MPSELQDLLQRIPTAEEGGVITSVYHNTLRAAIQSLASQIGVPTGQTLLTIAPGFLPNDPVANWPQHNGIAILSLEVVNLGEIQARARAEAEASAAAAITAGTRASAVARALLRTAGTLSVATQAINASNTAMESAADAETAARALAAAVAESDAEAKANDAVAKTEAALMAVLGARDLANSTMLLASSSVPPSPFIRFTQEANEHANAAASSAGEAFERAKAAAATITEAAEAQRRSKSGTCAGWLPLYLPDGAHIQNIVVSGRRRGITPGFQVNLVRQRISDSSETTLIALALGDIADDPFQVPAKVEGSGIAPADSFVDNTLYKYLITARVDAVTGAVAQINAIQVAYSR